MQYCPYCSAPVSENAKTCHNCKKSLEFEIIASALENSEESDFKKSALRKVWIKERMRYVWPVLTLIIGFIVGGVILYYLAVLEFSIKTDDLNAHIDSLDAQISVLKSNAQNAQSGLQQDLQSKDKIIGLLQSQRQTLASIINFTRRFSSSSTVTPVSDAEIESFRRNFLYLQRQFENQQDELNETKFDNDNVFNLKTIPQFLEE
jgi:hypothetical protein